MIRKRIDIGLFIVAGAGLFVSLPCLLYGFPFYGDDSPSHAIYYSNFAQQFWQGELYPRWLQSLNAGFGSPTSFYYPPFAYWLTSLLKPLFHHDYFGWQQLGISAGVAIVTSGVAFYLWIGRIVDRRAALIASLVYLLLPYHIDIDLYARGALAELWTFVWMPLIFLAVDGLAVRRRFAFVGLAASYAALVMTHLPTTLIFSPLLIIYALFGTQGEGKGRILLRTCAAISLGIGLSAVYLVPALAMQKYIFHTTEGVLGHYYYGNWFLFSKLRWSGTGSEYFLATVEAFALACLAFFLSLRFQPDAVKGKIRLWFVVAVCCFFMTTSWSDPLWRILPELEKIQFPWRFNTALCVASAAAVAFAVVAMKQAGKRSQIALYVLLTLCGLLWTYTSARRAYYSFPTNYVDQAVIEGINKKLEQQRDTSEFRPRWVVSINDEELDALVRRVGQVGNHTGKQDLENGAGSVRVERWNPRNIALDVDSPTANTLRISQFYFPGWTATIDGGSSVPVKPSVPGGLVSFAIPDGRHRVEIQLGKMLPEVAGEMITAASLIVAAFLFLRRRKTKNEVLSAEY